MASFIVYGDASGQVTVAAPAAAGTNTITFPAETGTLVTTAYRLHTKYKLCGTPQLRHQVLQQS
jgi:hypothetical protein